MNDRASEQGPAGNRLPLGDFVLDLQSGELLTADGRPVGLRRQSLGVLLLLGTRSGQVVTKDELMHHVWPGVVVGDGSLTQAVADIRRALGDQQHQLVRNVARRGYRLEPLWPSLPEQVPALSIAVMPLTVEGDASDTDWLADALHADLITEIYRAPGVLVIARDTMATYKGKPPDPRRVARELGVRHVVCGRLRRDGDQIRLNLALVDGASGVQGWADTFVTERAALPRALNDFAVQVERALHPEVVRVGAAQLEALSPDQVTADDLAMRAYALWFRGFTRDNVMQALSLIERAVQIDPDSQRAWSGVAYLSLHAALNGWQSDQALALQRIERAAVELERINRDSSNTYNAKTRSSCSGRTM